MVGYSKANPAARSLAGNTFCPPNTTSANSPITILTIKAGAGTKLGRFKHLAQGFGQLGIAHRLGRSKIYRSLKTRVLQDKNEGP